MMLWRLWRERNAEVWSGNAMEVNSVWSLAVRYLEDFQGVRKYRSSLQPSVTRCNSWHPPSPGMLKLNVDTTFFEDTLQMGFGMVLRNDRGEFCACRSKVVGGLYDVEVGEAFGVLEALSWIKNIGVGRVVV
ncbi:hypothetical protein ACS0TY_010223 [Phlomoides rotata]